MKRKFHLYPVYGATAGATAARLAVGRSTSRRRPRALLYTDSRGFEISKARNKRNPFSSAYARWVIANYDTTCRVAPHSHTTLLDFLADYDREATRYDLVVLHVGVVDFSSRPKRQVSRILEAKAPKWEGLLDRADLERMLAETNYGQYEGDETCSLYTPDQLRRRLSPALRAIEGLVWIGCNPVLEDWDGSYHRRRPPGMNQVLEHSAVLVDELDRTIDLSHWNGEQVREMTVDNIHFSSTGFEYLRSELASIVEPRRRHHDVVGSAT